MTTSTSTSSSSSPSPSAAPRIPTHPISSLQSAFAESLSPASSPQATHPLTQLISQLSFGLHLLSVSSLPSSQVPRTISIMQSHVTTMDRFLQHTEKTLVGHTRSIRKRSEHLSLPMSTPELKAVFDAMLCTHTFRMQLLSSVEIIDGVVEGTVKDLKGVAKDVSVALRDVEILAAFTREMERRDEVMLYPDTIGLADAEPLFAGEEGRHKVYLALRGNVDAWRRCLLGLQAKAASLASEVSRLKAIVREVEERVGWAGWRVRNQVLHAELHARDTLTARTAKPPLRIDTNLSNRKQSTLKSHTQKPLPSLPTLTPILFTLVPASLPTPPATPTSTSSSPTSEDEHIFPLTSPYSRPVAPTPRKDSFGSDMSWEEEEFMREGKTQVGVGVWVQGDAKKRSFRRSGKGIGKGVSRGWSFRGVFRH